MPAARVVELSCPAKLNLSLAILGRRPDGFHDLHSVVAPTGFGDTLHMAWRADGSPDADAVAFDQPLPAGDTTVAHALRLFREACSLRDGAFSVRVEKRIPVGAGLGGGSSNGAAALLALRQLFPDASARVDLAALAALIGSDCPLFLAGGPVVMEGRGERLRPLEAALADRIRGRRVVLFKPAFSIATAEAYRRLAQRRLYHEPDEVAALMRQWRAGAAPLPPRCNDFERLVDLWLPSLAVVLHRLRERHGMDVRMSGSGSACFAFPGEDPFAINALKEGLAAAWGGNYWLVETVVK